MLVLIRLTKQKNLELMQQQQQQFKALEALAKAYLRLKNNDSNFEEL